MGEGGVPVVGGFSDLVEVGRGGFSRVFSAYQVEFDRRVALKVLNDRLADDASVAVFEGECRAMGTLSQHPFIVTVLASALTADYRPCIVMELFERGNYMQVAAPRRAAATGGTAVARSSRRGRVGDGAPSRRGPRRREAPEHLEVRVRVPGAGGFRDRHAEQSPLRAGRDRPVGALRGAGADRIRRGGGGRGGGSVLPGGDAVHPRLRAAPLRGHHPRRSARAHTRAGAQRAHTTPGGGVPPRPRRHDRPAPCPENLTRGSPTSERSRSPSPPSNTAWATAPPRCPPPASTTTPPSPSTTPPSPSTTPPTPQPHTAQPPQPPSAIPSAPPRPPATPPPDGPTAVQPPPSPEDPTIALAPSLPTTRPPTAHRRRRRLVLLVTLAALLAIAGAASYITLRPGDQTATAAPATPEPVPATADTPPQQPPATTDAQTATTDADPERATTQTETTPQPSRGPLEAGGPFTLMVNGTAYALPGPAERVLGALSPDAVSPWTYDSSTGAFEAGDSPAAPFDPSIRAASQDYEIAWVSGLAESEWFQSVENSIQGAAAASGVHVGVTCDSEFDPGKAVACAETVSRSDPDAVIFANWRSEAAESLMEIFDDAAIPAITIDVWHPNAVLVGANNYVFGRAGRVCTPVCTRVRHGTARACTSCWRRRRSIPGGSTCPRAVSPMAWRRVCGDDVPVSRFDVGLRVGGRDSGHLRLVDRQSRCGARAGHQSRGPTGGVHVRGDGTGGAQRGGGRFHRLASQRGAHL